ncbi:MAG: cellulose biosynthesis cyclic di-GMP-binding regulatory protein BcsB [bacterium]
MKTPNHSQKSSLPAIFAPLLAVGLGIMSLQAASAGRASATQTFEVPLFSGTHSRIEGVLSNKEYAFKLPEHVRLEPGSEITLAWHGSPLLLADVSTLSVQLNDRELTSIRLGAKKDTMDAQDRGKITVPLPADALQPGWNRLVVNCLLQTTQSPCRDVDNPASWVELDSASLLRVAYAPTPLFPELQRFPESLTEPALMNLAEFRHAPSTEASEPVVSLLVASDAGEAELRTLLIAAARLGQTVYTDPHAVQVKDIATFSEESTARNGILIGQRSSLSRTPLPPDLEKAIASLGQGEGLLAEVIAGAAGNQRRWIVVCGADSHGLEKAAQTLGSEVALRNVPSNPWIVTDSPALSPIAEKLAQLPAGAVDLDSLRGGGITLRGLFRNQTSRNIHFPPGFQTTPGGYVDIDLAHCGTLEKTSAIDVRLNDVLIGSVALTPQNASGTRQRLLIPAGIASRDPSTLSVSSYLDIGLVDCAHRNDERAWVSLRGDSVVDFHAAPAVINDLSRLGLLCLRDAFLRRTAIIVPAESSPERNELLKNIGMHLGRQLADVPVLWPQVATYAPGLPPDPERIAGRSGLILGSAFQWPLAFGKNLRLAIEGGDSPSGSIMLRGEPVPVADFDPSLSFVQLLPSPWSKGELFATIGGVEGYGGETTLQLLTESSLSERLSGTVAAADASGRVVTYDVRFIQEVSLADQIRSGFASGTTPSDIDSRRMDQSEAGFLTQTVNYWIAGMAFATMAVLYAVQRIMVRRRQNPKRGEQL